MLNAIGNACELPEKSRYAFSTRCTWWRPSTWLIKHTATNQLNASKTSINIPHRHITHLVMHNRLHSAAFLASNKETQKHPLWLRILKDRLVRHLNNYKQHFENIIGLLNVKFGIDWVDIAFVHSQNQNSPAPPFVWSLHIVNEVIFLVSLFILCLQGINLHVQSRSLTCVTQNRACMVLEKLWCWSTQILPRAGEQ